MIDKGIRQKGLVDANGQIKNQAIIEQLYTNVLESGDLLKTLSDHEGLEGIAVRTGGGLKMILVNKSWLNIEAVIQAPKDVEITKSTVYQGQQPVSYTLAPGKSAILLNPETVVCLELK